MKNGAFSELRFFNLSGKLGLYHISLFFSILSEFKNINNSSQSWDNDRPLVSISARVLYPLGRIMVIIAVILISCPIIELGRTLNQ